MRLNKQAFRRLFYRIILIVERHAVAQGVSFAEAAKSLQRTDHEKFTQARRSAGLKLWWTIGRSHIWETLTILRTTQDFDKAWVRFSIRQGRALRLYVELMRRVDYPLNEIEETKAAFGIKAARQKLLVA